MKKTYRVELRATVKMDIEVGADENDGEAMRKAKEWAEANASGIEFESDGKKMILYPETAIKSLS